MGLFESPLDRSSGRGNRKDRPFRGGVLTGVTNQDRKYTNYPIYSGSGADCLSTVNTLCHKYLWRSELWTPIQEWGRKQYPNME